MATNALHKHLREGKLVISATALSKQYSVPVSTTTRLLKDYGYSFVGENWVTSKEKTKDNSELNLTEKYIQVSPPTAEKFKSLYKLSVEDLEDSIETALKHKLYVEIIKCALVLQAKKQHSIPVPI